MRLTIILSGGHCLHFPASMRFLQLIVLFIAVLIAHAQKLVVVCKMLMMDPNDCATSLSSSGRCFIDVFIKLSEQQGWMHIPKYFLFIGEKYQTLREIGGWKMPDSYL